MNNGTICQNLIKCYHKKTTYSHRIKLHIPDDFITNATFVTNSDPKLTKLI